MAAVETQDLTRTFGDFIAVDKLTISIKEGSIYGFLGPNGSGKSTTIKMLCGLLMPSSGSGTILGLDISKDSEQIKAKIGYMSQKFSLYDDLKVRENLNFYAGMYSLTGEAKRFRIKEMIAMAGLTGREDELTGNLSGGWKQRLALGCSIIHKPSILFLDEPTGGVDPKSRRMFWDIIYDLAIAGTTVMVTTHFMDEAEHCDRIGFIYEGKLIADDAPAQLKQQLPGVLLEIAADDPIHILARPEQVGFFAALNPQKILPSLEDVFVYYVKSQRGAAGA